MFPLVWGSLLEETISEFHHYLQILQMLHMTFIDTINRDREINVSLNPLGIISMLLLTYTCTVCEWNLFVLTLHFVPSYTHPNLHLHVNIIWFCLPPHPTPTFPLLGKSSANNLFSKAF